MNCDPLVSQLAEQGVRIRHDKGRTMVVLPWPPLKIPEPVKALLIQYREKQAATARPLNPEPATGNVTPLHKMRDNCQTAGHCLGMIKEIDCNLYPVRPGWCKPRTSAKRR